MRQSRRYYKLLRDNWDGPAGNGTPNPCCFMTHLTSKDVMDRALCELSYADVRNGSLRLPDGMEVVWHEVFTYVKTARNRIVLVTIHGKFTMEQAREVIRVFSKYADHKANAQEDLGGFAKKLQKNLPGQIVVAW